MSLYYVSVGKRNNGFNVAVFENPRVNIAESKDWTHDQFDLFVCECEERFDMAIENRAIIHASFFVSDAKWFSRKLREHVHLVAMRVYHGLTSILYIMNSEERDRYNAIFERVHDFLLDEDLILHLEKTLQKRYQ